VNNLETNTGEAYDGDANNPYFNIWKSGSLQSSMQQTLTSLPAGEYQLCALLRGTAGLDLILKAEHTTADGQTTTPYSTKVVGTGNASSEADAFKNGWQQASLSPITIHHGDQLTIAAEVSSSATAWWSVDHFQFIYRPLPEEPDVISGISTARLTVSTYYTLDGRKVQGVPRAGIYILHKADGTTRKVLIR
jgi:hypothetical protein